MGRRRQAAPRAAGLEADGRPATRRCCSTATAVGRSTTASNTVYRATLPRDHKTTAKSPCALARPHPGCAHPPDPAGRRCRARSPATSPGARPTRSGSRRATTAACSAASRLAWDAEQRRPAARRGLRAQRRATRCSSSRPTSISLRLGARQRPSPSRRRPDAKVVDLDAPSGAPAAPISTAAVTGLKAVQAAGPPFTITAPATLVGLPPPGGPPRRLDGHARRARDLRPGPRRHRRAASAAQARPQTPKAPRDGAAGCSLPKVSINGASGPGARHGARHGRALRARRRRLHRARLRARRRPPRPRRAGCD